MERNSFAGRLQMSESLAGLAEGPIAIRTSEGVAHVLRKAILAGVLPPGRALQERKIAAELGVSRTPVREALFTLHGEGLVELSPGRCARVRQVVDSDLGQIYALRGILESYAAGLAAAGQDKAKLNRVEDAFAAQKRLGQTGSAMEQAYADLAFHEAIAEAAGNPLLLTLMRQVLAITVSYRATYKYTSARAAHVFAQHAGILKALWAADAAKARDLMAGHIQESADLAMEIMRKSHEPVAVAKKVKAA
jgi:DNA-binding GntR family transcriptional regulator